MYSFSMDDKMVFIVITVQVCGSSFVGSMIWQYESLRQQAQEVMKGLDRQFGQMFEPSYGKEMGFRAHVRQAYGSYLDTLKCNLN